MFQVTVLRCVSSLCFPEAPAGRTAGGLRSGGREENSSAAEHQDGVEGHPPIQSVKPSIKESGQI